MATRKSIARHAAAFDVVTEHLVNALAKIATDLTVLVKCGSSEMAAAAAYQLLNLITVGPALPRESASEILVFVRERLDGDLDDDSAEVLKRVSKQLAAIKPAKKGTCDPSLN